MQQGYLHADNGQLQTTSDISTLVVRYVNYEKLYRVCKDDFKVSTFLNSDDVDEDDDDRDHDGGDFRGPCKNYKIAYKI